MYHLNILMKHKWGYALYHVHQPLIKVLKTCQKNDLYCYQLYEKDEITYVSFRIIDTPKVEQAFPQATYMYTNGLFGMLLRNFKNKTRVLSYILVIVLWCFYSTRVFDIQVYGESDRLDDKIQLQSKKYMYESKDVAMMKSELLTTFKKDVSWLEVYQKGNIINVRYALQQKVEEKGTSQQPLIAKKDGMIAFFKCKEGYRVKNVNDVVKKGEILVDNKMPDSFNQSKSINVEGKVYAYTWKEVVVEVDKNKLPDAINFYSLLLEARNEVHINIKEDEHIEKENVLHFSENKGKMKLKVLYTLLEDITS